MQIMSGCTRLTTLVLRENGLDTTLKLFQDPYRLQPLAGLKQTLRGLDVAELLLSTIDSDEGTHGFLAQPASIACTGILHGKLRYSQWLASRPIERP